MSHWPALKTKEFILQGSPRDEWMAVARQHGFTPHPASTENWPTLARKFGPLNVLVFDAPNTPFVHISTLHQGHGFISSQVSVEDLDALLARTVRVLDQYATPRTWMDNETLNIIHNTLEFGP
jgi:hypothetical protein